MRCKIEYEFEFDLGKGEEYNQEILDCIEEDVPDAMQKCMDNIFKGARCTGYKIINIKTDAEAKKTSPNRA